jgi:hypothetical protein
MANVASMIEHLGKKMGITLSLDRGVCAIFDRDRELVVIEIAPSSDLVILHRVMAMQHEGNRSYEHLLKLNFDITALAGCWLALDSSSQARLCAQLPMLLLDEVYFSQWVEGFVNLCSQVETLLGAAPHIPRTA